MTFQPAGSVATFTEDVSLCNHPDAIKRRLEQQQWKIKRDAERAKAAQMAEMGLKWHQQPSSIVSCSTPEQFKQMVEQASQEGRLLVAKMFTEDCYVCKSLYPKMRKIAADNSDVIWVKLNGSDPAMVGLFASLGVTKVPLFHMVLDGQLVAELSASLSPEKLARFRAELAAHKPQQPGTASLSSRAPTPTVAATATN